MHCNHPGCDCGSASVERNGKSYCSEACATGIARASESGGGCGCGHAGCGKDSGRETTRASESGSTSGGGQGLHARGGEGSASFRASAPGESAGLRGDGQVGDTRQRTSEQPGHSGPTQTDDSRRLGFSGEDRAGSAMKPGAAKPRGVEAPGGSDGNARRVGSSEDVERPTVRRGPGPQRDA